MVTRTAGSGNRSPRRPFDRRAFGAVTVDSAGAMHDYGRMGAPTRKTILLVEDEALVAVAEKAALERLGYAVLVAGTGEQAVAAVGDDPGIDLVLMDMDLGAGMDGAEAAELILAERELPLVFVSGHLEARTVEKTERISSYGYILKNSNAAVLDASIRMAFRLFEANRLVSATLGKLEATFAALPDLLFEVGLDGRYYDIYSHQSELLYQPKSELIGRTIPELLPEPAARSIMAAIREAHERGSSNGYEYSLPVPAGTRWFEISVSRLSPGPDQPHFLFLCRDVTDRKSLETERDLSEAKFRGTFDRSPVGAAIVGLDKKFLRCNAAFCSFLGYGEDELAGKSIADVTFAEDRNLGMEELGLILARELESFATEKRYVRKDGSLVWGEVRISAVFDAAGRPSFLLPVIWDINKRKQAEAALQASEERYRAIVENTGEGIAFLGSDGTFAFANGAADSIFGLGHGQLKGLPLDLFLAGDGSVAAREALAAGGDRNVAELEIVRPSGDRRNLIVTSVPQPDPAKGVHGAYWVFRDITERILAEKSIRRLLEEKELILKEVHHRIKNNMASVMGLLSMHADSRRNPEAAAVLEDAIGRVHSMSLLYDKLYRSASFTDMNLRDYLPALVEQIVGNFPNAETVRVETRVGDFRLGARQVQNLGIIVNELITNSMKYAFAGRAGGLISVSASLDDGKVLLKVADDGVAGEAAEGHGDDTGFGQVLVENLTRQLGGAFSVDRSAGTAYSFSIPL